MFFVVAILTAIAALSPLLTLSWLWQIKEWRWDRLREHLRREGMFHQLWGRIRPGVFALFVIVTILTCTSHENAVVLLTLTTLIIYAMLTAIQVITRRQRYPILTQKALTITVTAFLFTLATIGVMLALLPLTLPAVVLAQPLMLAAAWVVWKPVDILLKNRIIAAAKRARDAHPDLVVIGVTGSVGKTTTKELIACVLKDLHPAVTPAYLNAEIGVARWLSSQLETLQKPEPEPGPAEGPPKGKPIVIVEMGAYRTGEIALLCSFVKPTLGIVTHVGNQHIALFGSQEKLFEAKSELVQSLPNDGRAFLNGDNALARTMREKTRAPATIVGTGGHCDLEAFDIEETPTGIRFRVRESLFEVPLHGTHNVTNVLLAIAVGEHLGISLQRMRDLLHMFTPLSNTFSVRDDAGVRILDDTHNSSVASMKAAIAWARTQPFEHKILLTAGLIEMGDEQVRAEEELGTHASDVFERVIVIDPLSAKNFGAGSVKNVEMLKPSTAKVPPESLLVCTGRMPASVINKLLQRTHNS